MPRLPTTNKLSHADAEQIAIGTLLLEGTRVRMTGQDSRRGTFTQRQAVLRDEKTGDRVTLLDTITPDQKTKFEVFDSPLSEYSVVGFEYGYSRASTPRRLVMWEARIRRLLQYGAGGDRSVHGLERDQVESLGGPRGCSCRTATRARARSTHPRVWSDSSSFAPDDNMEVVYPSTRRAVFHMLRRQTNAASASH